MKKYNLINNIFGWFSFAVAAIVYLMTIEPTASFWDCGEFITSAYKLEVGHPRVRHSLCSQGSSFRYLLPIPAKLLQ